MKKDVNRFILFISMAFSFLVIFLIFEYFMFTEVQIDLKIPLENYYDQISLFIDGREIPIDPNRKRSFLRLRKGNHNLKIVVNDIVLLDENIKVEGENPRISLSLPEPPRVQDVRCEYSADDGMIKINWRVNSKVDFFEIFKDNLKIARVKMNEFRDRYGDPLEVHEYTIIPFYAGGKLRGVGGKLKAGPFVELADLKLRIVTPYDVSKDDLVVSLDGKNLKLSDTFLAVAEKIPVGPHRVRVKVKGNVVLEKEVRTTSGSNEEILELPDLPVLDSATAIVCNGKMKISWLDPSNDIYRIDHYDVVYSFDSSSVSLSTTKTNVELPTLLSSGVHYAIGPVFVGDLKGVPYEFFKPPKPSICFDLIPRTATENTIFIRLETCDNRKDVIFLFSVDGMEYEQVDGTSLNLKLEDGVHILKLKAIDGFYQEDEGSLTILVDTRPPEPPSSLTVFVDGNLMDVSWSEPESTDVKECKIRTSRMMRMISMDDATARFDVSNVSGTVTIFVRCEDRVGNSSESSITVDLPKVPSLIESTVTFSGDGNDVNVRMVFQDYSGGLVVYLDSMEILHTTGTDVSFRLENLEYDKTYDLTARLENVFGSSTVEKLISFKTKLPPPKILSWDYKNGKLHLKFDAVGSKFQCEIVGGSYSTSVLSDSTDVIIPIKEPGTYLLKIKAMTEDNESSESVEMIEIPEGGS